MEQATLLSLPDEILRYHIFERCYDFINCPIVICKSLNKLKYEMIKDRIIDIYNHFINFLSKFVY